MGSSCCLLSQKTAGNQTVESRPSPSSRTNSSFLLKTVLTKQHLLGGSVRQRFAAPLGNIQFSNQMLFRSH